MLDLSVLIKLKFFQHYIYEAKIILQLLHESSHYHFNYLRSELFFSGCLRYLLKDHVYFNKIIFKHLKKKNKQ